MVHALEEGKEENLLSGFEAGKFHEISLNSSKPNGQLSNQRFT